MYQKIAWIAHDPTNLILALSLASSAAIANSVITEMYPLRVLEVRSPKPRCQQGHAFCDGSRRKCFHASSSSWCLPESLEFLGLRRHNSNLYLHLYMAFFSVSLYFRPSCPFSYRVLVLGLRAHSKSRPSSRSFITSTKVLFPNKVKFMGTGG